MAKSELKNAPNLEGWAIAAAMGLVAGVVALMVGEFRNEIAGFIGAIIFVLAGLVMGMPWGAEVPPVPATPLAHKGHAPATAETPAPVAVAQPASLLAAPAPAAVMDMPSAGPEQLSAPRGGKADDLKEIEGIGPALEKLCNELGFYHYDQIASWSDADVVWVDQHMKTFKGRILRDKWVVQARLICNEGLEAFRVRAKTNNY